MKSLGLLAAIGFTATAHAGEGIFGTKLSPTPMSTSSPVSAMPILQMLAALFIVLGLIKWVLPFLMKKTKIGGKAGGSAGIKILESTSVGALSLNVVEVRGKVLLIGATQAGASCLADLTDAPKLEEPKLFSEMLEEAQVQPAAPLGLDNDISVQLDRLSRLGV